MVQFVLNLALTPKHHLADVAVQQCFSSAKQPTGLLTLQAVVKTNDTHGFESSHPFGQLDKHAVQAQPNTKYLIVIYLINESVLHRQRHLPIALLHLKTDWTGSKSGHGLVYQNGLIMDVVIHEFPH